MPSYDNDDDVFDSHYLSAQSSTQSRKSPARPSINNRRSNASLRSSSSLGHDLDDEGANGRHSLAHELAVALMPEPSAGSKLLAEEFGIEYDEGAEGIDEPVLHENGVHILVSDAQYVDTNGTGEHGDGMRTPTFASGFPDASQDVVDIPSSDYDPVFGSPSIERKKKPQKRLEQDAMVILAQDLESTDKFLNHLRRIDTSSSSPSLERLASDVIRRLNETARDREGQLRELLEYEREFRKIAGEVGGTEVLGQLEELSGIEGSPDTRSSAEPSRPEAKSLDTVEEEDASAPHMNSIHDWETDPNHHHLGDEDEETEILSPIKDSFPAPPPITGPITPAKAIPQLAHLRSFTTSLVSSLTTLSEQAQVNGAATTEAGRKIRALKNKMGEWRTDWDSAERSRTRIEKWEAGIIESESTGLNGVVSPSKLATSKRVDGRALVQEHLQAFERALADAAVKTQAIMAS
ncbi:hypothetical protein BDN72DRAFT_832670 [Pluteus cervinus]|uniref:Uncharacterized protein n=1 Tax=Pluteus cervinus TaxID=181527 RepID=A0ACD3BA36_9AGAR|nr:hypothetical protein BDN72DRAFT_832670 [Pluteus cervinus]